MKADFQHTETPIEPQTLPSETPSFLLKLWMLLENAEYSQYISWSQNGTSFTIINQSQFSQIVLPKYFKHSHLTSFVRQLNMYGFRKLTTVTYNTTANQEPLQFHHPQFLQGHPELLQFVKRKSPSSFRIGSKTIKTADLEKLLTDFEQIKFEHETLLREIQTLKLENTSLRSEVIQLKSKYSRHEQVLARMLNFIILNALYPERTLSLLPGMKRRRYMLENSKSSQSVTFPETPNASLAINGSYNDLANNARNLLQPIDPSNISYPSYLNVDNVLPSHETNENSLTLYNNFQSNPQNLEYKLGGINPSNQKGSHIRDDIRKAVLAKTGGVDTAQHGIDDGQFQMSQHPNNNYHTDLGYDILDYEQYGGRHWNAHDIDDFPDDMGLDSSLLSELLLPNPTSLDTSLLQNFNNIPNPQLFNSDIQPNTDVNSCTCPPVIDESNEENSPSLNRMSINRKLI